MGLIVPRFMDFDEGQINKSNVTLKLWKLSHQNLLFLNIGTPNLVSNGKIDERWNKYAIINYCIIVPIPYESIEFSHIIIFHEQDETKQMLFWGQLGWSPINAMWLPYGPCMTNNGWDHKL
jgi:hypothetical protein